MSLVQNRKDLVFGLDIGTRSVVGTVGYKNEKNRFQVVAQEVQFHSSRAMLDGQIHDIEKVSEVIREVKQKLEERLNLELKDVCIAAAGRVLKTVIGSCEEEFEENQVVDGECIYSLDMLGVEKANEILIQENQTEDKFLCVGYTVVHYYLNGFAISNLEGHKARKIGAEVLATFLPEDVVDGLYAAVAGAGLEVVNLTLEPIAAMNVAIPEQFRMLNIALIDVGAGTSDICITRDGSVAAYGMIPYAGDKFTECLVQKYLIDFQTAEKIKTMSGKKQMQFEDIMGTKQKITKEALDADLAPYVEEMSILIADKIKELNGGNSVSAVFVVGGGGKVSGFTESLAKALDIMPNRVALRGQEVMGEIDMLDDSLKKDSLFVTPIGICINFYENKNNFTFVTVNQKRVKIYNNNKLAVMDAAAAAGYPNDKLFPRRGKDITFTINGKQRIVRGQKGEPAQIRLNHSLVSMSTQINANDKIEITESTIGEPAYLEVGQLPEFQSQIRFRVNNKSVSCPKIIKVNDAYKSEFYSIEDGDSIVILDFYTVEQLIQFLDLKKDVTVYVNHEKADVKERIYDNYMVDWEVHDDIETETNSYITRRSGI